PSSPPLPTSTLSPYTTLFRCIRLDRLPAQLRHRLLQDPRVGVEAHRRDRPRLFLAEQLARAADLQIVGGHLEPRDLEIRGAGERSEEHTSELQSQSNRVCRIL